MLTKNDLKEISKLFQKLFPINIKPVTDEIKAVNSHNARIETKLNSMEEKFEKNLEKWKSEVCDRIDPILKKITTAEEENVVLRSRDEGRQEKRGALEKRIKKLELIHPDNRHIHP
ncbi:hypothetical protein A3D78_02790 [Candidatus Gottesmanbacteria bacterium RIFCSPHIGHO2_02_FULL_39_14]|uniref:Uncharacterized protein n=1 Tax=Candidatus Gottesmanbacteria bacterium RIFCSPHIGHO2_02_FULL_39_14 TaxID=1798383 RepID=A0A1F5ZYK4_9BACT|nr:MAG: hypothetical protein A3D78_02790 [Candidatus Gottesmanbacteria bacterium RIFCSPHIGHO2_02_FULL_39_14]